MDKILISQISKNKLIHTLNQQKKILLNFKKILYGHLTIHKFNQALKNSRLPVLNQVESLINNNINSNNLKFHIFIIRRNNLKYKINLLGYYKAMIPNRNKLIANRKIILYQNIYNSKSENML